MKIAVYEASGLYVTAAVLPSPPLLQQCCLPLPYCSSIAILFPFCSSIAIPSPTAACPLLPYCSLSSPPQLPLLPYCSNDWTAIVLSSSTSACSPVPYGSMPSPPLLQQCYSRLPSLTAACFPLPYYNVQNRTKLISSPPLPPRILIFLSIIILLSGGRFSYSGRTETRLKS